MNRSVILLSGGLDSTTTLFYAQRRGFKTAALIFNYGQRHKKEVERAKAIAHYAGCDYHVVKIALPWKGSALLDQHVAIPENRNVDVRGIPPTYVPARNVIFLSFAVSYAEAIGAARVFIGANAIDYSGYPDCRPEFFVAFEDVLSKGLKSGVEGNPIKIEAPFLKKTKAQIIKAGLKLKVPYHLTWSCYKGGARPCGVCDSCILRQRGFAALKVRDPLLSI